LKQKIILSLCFFSLIFVSCSNKYDVELSDEKRDTCLYWLEEYFIDTRPVLPEYEVMFQTEKSLLKVGLDLSTSEENYDYDISTTNYIEFYYDLINMEPMGNYVCDFWYDIMQ